MSDYDVLFPALAGALISLACSYIPGLADWYAGLDGTRKRLVMLLALLLVVAGYMGMACAPFGAAFGVPPEACSGMGAAAVLRAFLTALVANQSTYLVTPK